MSPPGKRLFECDSICKFFCSRDEFAFIGGTEDLDNDLLMLHVDVVGSNTFTRTRCRVKGIPSTGLVDPRRRSPDVPAPSLIGLARVDGRLYKFN